jgi:ABC-type multidrug transport system fused ATPase/permease subunit
MTFISSARRLLAPIKQAKFETFLQTIYYASRPLSWMAAVYFLQQLTQNIQNNNQTNLESNLLYFGIFIVVYNTRLFIWRNRTWVRMTEKYAKIIQSEYMLKFLELDNNFTDKKWTWYLISVFEKGIYQWSESIQNISRYTSGFIVSIWFIIYSFSRLPPVVNIGLVSVLLICVWIVIYLSKWVSPIRAIENHHQNNRSKSVVRVIMSKMEIVQNGQFSNSIDWINQISNQIINTKYIRSKYIYFMYNLPEILISVIQFGVFWIMWYGVLQWTYLLSDLVLVSWSIAIISTTLNEFTTFYKDFYKDFGKVEQLRKLIDEWWKIDYEKWQTFNHKHWNISFDNISYAYSPDKPVFHNFNLSIIWWKKIALVWPSWWWKSTLIKLIAGYIRPDEGNIIIDWQSLSETSLKSYYKHIWYLTQEPSVFDGTIRENLMYW